jgi:hypothetical protein
MVFIFINILSVLLNKKMNFHYLSVIVFCLISINSIIFTNSLRSDDFCKKELFTRKCMAYDCGTKYCTFDKASCTHFISWGIVMKKKSKIVYKHFIDNIKACPLYQYKNRWSHRLNFG